MSFPKEAPDGGLRFPFIKFKHLGDTIYLKYLRLENLNI